MHIFIIACPRVPDQHEEFLERSFQDAIAIAAATNQDIIRPEYWRYHRTPTKKIDEYTFLYAEGPEENWRILRYDPASEQAGVAFYQPRQLNSPVLKEEIGRYEKGAVDYQPSEAAFAVEIRAQRLCKDKVIRVGGVGLGIPIESAEIWLEAMLTDPGIVKSYINQEVEIARKNVEFLIQFEFRYFFGGLDFASETGPLYSPRLFKELVLPGVKAVSEICHRNRAYHLFASDGNLWPVAEFLFRESGIDGYYEIDRKAGMDLEKLRKDIPE